MLDNCELNKTYVLNPLAAEFVPRARRQLLHEQQQQRVSLLQNMIAAAKAAEASAAAMQAAAAHQQRRNSNIPAFFPHAPPPPPSPMTPPFMSHAHVQAALAQAAGMHLPPPFIFPPNHQLPVFPPAVHPLMQRLPLPPPPLPLPALTRGAGQRQFMTPPPPMMPLPHQQQPRPPLALNAAHAQLSAQARPTASQQGGPRPEFLFKEGVHFPSQAVAVPKPPGAPPPLPSGSGDVIDIALSLLPLDMDIGAFLQSQSTQVLQCGLTDLITFLQLFCLFFAGGLVQAFAGDKVRPGRQPVQRLDFTTPNEREILGAGQNPARADPTKPGPSTTATAFGPAAPGRPSGRVDAERSVS